MATETRSFKCMKCKQDVVFDLPQHEILNGQLASIITFSHPRPDICPHCGQAYLVAIDKSAGVGVVWGWVAVAIEQDRGSDVILPPGVSDPRKTH